MRMLQDSMQSGRSMKELEIESEMDSEMDSEMETMETMETEMEWTRATWKKWKTQ